MQFYQLQSASQCYIYGYINFNVLESENVTRFHLPCVYILH